jgi:NADH-quinone oxidoreductase subunit F
MIQSLNDLHKIKEDFKARSRKFDKTVKICFGTGCVSSGAQGVYDGLISALKKASLDKKIRVVKTGCHGFCEKGPIVVFNDDEIFYQSVGKKKMDEDVSLLMETIKTGKVADKLLYESADKSKRFVSTKEIPFYAGQKKIVLEFNGTIDPEDIDEYIANDGYTALHKVLTSMKPDDVLEWIQKSGLRGRGGGGFSTGTKWKSCKDAHGNPKYILANGDEGDPGAFMDRSLMEGNPAAIIEGMIIGGYTIGANQGYIYVRDEYPLAVKRLSIAIEQAGKYGLLGKNIFNTGFDFDIKIFRGGGAFVCGESTALMSSIEGKSGEPRAKYVHTVERGLWDKPSNLNNVETWACVPVIVNRGWEWFSSIGNEGSKGTKVFSLVGKVNNTGLIEVPLGTTLRKIIYDLGDGIQKNKEFKAVQTGGPSGGCIPKEYLDTPVDFDTLWELGSMMGSGGMIVMDDRNCMVDFARYFLHFLLEESCGKCVPCREGTRRMLEILNRICEGKGMEGDIEHLKELGKAVNTGSLCGLGQTAANPVLSTLRYFMAEYEAHIRDKKCPAGVCKPLISYSITKNCTGCMRCVKECPQSCITGEKKKRHKINQKKCIKCGMCYEVCKFDAVHNRRQKSQG